MGAASGRVGVAWLLVLNAHGIPILNRSHGTDSPPLVLQGLVNGLFSAGVEANARISCIASRVCAASLAPCALC